jgi:sodium pump decarboxylase gamma subunit
VGGIILHQDRKNVSGDVKYMIIQGLKLTVLGMGVVFCFLVLLFALISLSSKLLAPFTKKEISLANIKKPVRARAGKKKGSDDTLKLTAVISAAIATHRAHTGRHR